MKASTRRMTQLTTGIALLIFALTAATPALARAKAALKVQAVTTSDGAIVVEVANPTPRPLRGTIVVRAWTTRGVVAVIASLDVSAGETGTVRMDLPDAAIDVPPVGVVVDDGVPF